MTTPLQQIRYATVVLNGARKVLTRLAIDLRKSHFDVGRPNDNVLCVDDVAKEEIPEIQAEAQRRGCYIESLRGEFFVDVPSRIKKADKTDIQDGKWYFAERMEDTYPFVFVRSRRTEAMDRMGLSPEQVVVLQLELLDGSGSTPRKLQADTKQIMDFGLRLATEEDFTEWDLPIPAEVHLQARMDEERENQKKAAVQPNLQRLANFQDV